MRRETGRPWVWAGLLVLWIGVMSCGLPFYILGFFRIPEVSRYGCVWYLILTAALGVWLFFRLVRSIARVWGRSDRRRRGMYGGLVFLVVMCLVGGVVFCQPLSRAYGQGFADYLRLSADPEAIYSWARSQEIPNGKDRFVSRSRCPDSIRKLMPHRVRLEAAGNGPIVHLEWDRGVSEFEWLIGTKEVPLEDVDDGARFVYKIGGNSCLVYKVFL